MGWSKATAETGTDEAALMGALERLDRHRQNRWGLELRMSALRAYHKRPQNIRAVRKLLTPLRQRFEASIFQLASGDLFILMQCPNIGEAKPVLLNILNLFVEDPLLADKVYGGTRRDVKAPPYVREAAELIGRQALHAQVLSFNHPRTGALVRCEAPLPEDFRRALERLRRG